MQADTAATPDIYADDAPGKSGNGKARLLSIEDLDGRTRASRHCQQIRDEILNDLGGADQLSTLERRAAEHVSILDAMIADLGVRWLKGYPADPAALTSLVNTFNRSATVLGWQRRARDITPSLDDYMANRAAQKAGEDA